MPNGEVRIVAVPPDGCVVAEPFKLRKAPRSSPAVARDVAPPAAPAPPPAPWPPRVEPAAASAEQPTLAGDELVHFVETAMSSRRAIEERAEAVGEKLERHRESVAALPPIVAESFQDSPRGAAAYEAAVRQRDEMLVKLRTEELAILRELEAVEDEFATLSGTVAAAHGGDLPETWPPQIQCEACPRS